MSNLSSLALLAVIALFVFLPSNHLPPEATFELPEEIKPPQFSLPESPLLHPQPSPERLAQQLKARRAQLESAMMYGKPDPTRHVPAGATDPDALLRGQVDRANRTLKETGMGHLNLQGR